jgi:electron transport complex protein RnfC
VAFLPTISVIPLVQEGGGRVSAVVSVGDTVKEGMLIGWGSPNVHATVPGKVVRRVSWKNAYGREIEALVIRMGGHFEKLGKKEEAFPWETLLPQDLRRLVSDFGIVEMEGSGRAAVQTLAAASDARRGLSLVVRCVFDDPWLAADYTLCRERYKAVVEGCRIAAKIARAERIVFAFSHRERDLGDLFLREAGSLPATLMLTGSRYPQRNRRELELALRDYEKREQVPLGSLLMLGPATLAALRDAVCLRKPILDRYVAVGGSAVKKPQVMRVRIGTRIGEVFAGCGGFVGKPRRIVSGSPLQGRSVADLDEPVLKTTFAIFASLDGRTGTSGRWNCIGCGECRRVCPVGLDPEELYKGLASDPAGGGESRALCHGCGCCELVCPSRLPIARVIYSFRGDS